MSTVRITDRDWDIVEVLSGKESSLPQIHSDLGKYSQSQQELVRRLERLMGKGYVVPGEALNTYTSTPLGQKAFDQGRKRYYPRGSGTF